MRTQDEILVASLDKIKSVIPVTPSTQLYDAINTMVDEITSLHQQLAEQPNVDVLVEALKHYSYPEVTYRSSNAVALKALATYQSKNEKE